MAGKWLFFSGATETQAVIEAAARLGVASGELAYRVRSGHLRQGRVVIEVDPAAPRRAATAAAPAAEGLRPERLARSAREPEQAHGPPRPVAAPVEPGREPAASGPWVAADPTIPERRGERTAAAARSLALLAGLELEPAVEDSPEAVHVELSGPGRPALVARRGELLQACEYLLRRMVRELPEDGLVLDSGGFRAERERALRAQAAEAAAAVRRSGEAIVLEPLPAAERRVVHLQVQEEAGVTSASEGEGEVRRVRILPAG
jgi:predicted RNA-binding protein Jag